MSEYVEKSPAFSVANRTRVKRFIEQAAASADSMTREEFLLCLLRIAAFADNGHDTLRTDGSWWPQARLPVRMIWFPSGWAIARADSAHVELLGARVLRIENLSSEAMFRRLRGLAGGIDSNRRWNLEPFVERAGLLHAAGVARQPDRLTLSLQLRDGRRFERTLFFAPAADSGELGSGARPGLEAIERDIGSASAPSRGHTFGESAPPSGGGDSAGR